MGISERENMSESAGRAGQQIDGRDWIRCASSDLAIDLHRKVLPAIAECLTRVGSMPPDGRQDVGGILLGSPAADGQPWRIESLDVYCSPALRDVLRIVSKRISERADLTMVGCFRVSRSADSERITEELSRFRSGAPDATTLFMLITPDGTQTAIAHFSCQIEGEEARVSGTLPLAALQEKAGRIPLRDVDDSEIPKHSTIRRSWRAVAAMAVVAGGLEAWRETSAKASAGEKPPKAVEVAAESSGVGLFAVQENNLVRIVWEPKARDVFHALSATLTISDGEKRSTVVLDGIRLAAGLYWYSPGSTDVRVKMALIAADGRETEAEAKAAVKLAPPPPAPPLKKRPEAPVMRIPPLPSPVLPPRARPRREPSRDSSVPVPPSIPGQA